MLESITSSPFFIGVLMIFMNIGSRYITHEFSSSDDEYMQNIILRRVAVFAVCYTATRDLWVSIILTAGFVILASGLFRGRSDYAREGMSNPDDKLRAAAGLKHKVEAPAYDTKAEPMFTA